MVSEFCARRLAPVLPGDVVQTLQRYMVELLAREEYPPYRGAGLNLTALAQTLSLDRVLLQSQKAQLSSVFDAIARAVAEGRLRTGLPARGSTLDSISARIALSGTAVSRFLYIETISLIIDTALRARVALW